MKLFVTYDALVSRLAERNGSGVELAHNEYLTPAAMDLAQQRHLAVRRMPDAGTRGVLPLPLGEGRGEGAPRHPTPPETPSPGPKVTLSQGERANAASSLALGFIVARADEKVRGLIGSLGRGGLSLADYTFDPCWMRNLRAMGEAIVANKLRAGVAVLPYAADAMVLANKIRGIRAVQGTSRAAVQAGIRHYAANLLIVEHAASTFHELRVTIQTFASECSRGTIGAAMLAMLTELEASD